MSDEISNQNADDAERVAELALRPKTLKEFVGQYRVRDQLDLLLCAARERKSPEKQRQQNPSASFLRDFRDLVFRRAGESIATKSMRRQ
mgnify:CR=1 FL=1